MNINEQIAQDLESELSQYDRADGTYDYQKRIAAILKHIERAMEDEHWPRKPQTDSERERDKREIESLLGTTEIGHENLSAQPQRSEIDELRQELAGERGRCEQAEQKEQHWSKVAEMFRVQLLSAQAAIEKHNEDQRRNMIGEFIDDIDLSLLHQHDAEQFRKGWEAGHKVGAEMRKPLVEMLRSVHTWFMQKAPQHYNGCGLWLDVSEFLIEHPRLVCILEVDSPTLPPDDDERRQCGCQQCLDALAKAKEQ